jgi:hypothetical protein
MTRVQTFAAATFEQCIPLGYNDTVNCTLITPSDGCLTCCAGHRVVRVLIDVRHSSFTRRGVSALETHHTLHQCPVLTSVYAFNRSSCSKLFHQLSHNSPINWQKSTGNNSHHAMKPSGIDATDQRQPIQDVVFVPLLLIFKTLHTSRGSGRNGRGAGSSQA